MWLERLGYGAEGPGPEVIKIFSCSSQLSMKFSCLEMLK